MASLDIEKYRKRILAERERLVATRHRSEDDESMSQAVGELTDFDPNHPGDTGTETFEREKDFALSANVDGLLAQIDEALGKIDAGTYGACDRCGKPIADARLSALPYATLCIDCQGIVENQ